MFKRSNVIDSIEKISEQIASNKILEATEDLLAFSRTLNSSSIQNTAILICADYNELMARDSKGLLDFKEFRLIRNKIIVQMLSLIHDISNLEIQKFTELA